jgi:hypothetical protein
MEKVQRLGKCGAHLACVHVAWHTRHSIANINVIVVVIGRPGIVWRAWVIVGAQRIAWKLERGTAGGGFPQLGIHNQ